MPEPYDVITMGRIGVDIYPLQTGVPLAKVETFGKFLGGSPSNVAVAAARLGRRTAVITRTGQDAFGDYLHQALAGFGVDDRWVTAVARYPTPVTFCEIFPPDHFPLYFYRQPKAPDLEIHRDELDLDAVRAARVFWMTGTGLCAEPSRSATLAALRARSAAQAPGEAQGPRATVFDLDWRPMFWDGGAQGSGAGGGEGSGSGEPPPTARYREALAHATVAVGNLDECEIATGEREPYAAARALLAAGVELAVVKQGPAGVLAVHRDGTTAEIPPLPVEVVNGLGAGDAFGGALCHGLLAGWETARIMRYANAAGAIVASRLACSSAMPYPHEVEQALADGAVEATGTMKAPGPAETAATPEAPGPPAEASRAPAPPGTPAPPAAPGPHGLSEAAGTAGPNNTPAPPGTPARQAAPAPPGPAEAPRAPGSSGTPGATP
ncbi:MULTISPECIES: 5-dehydro-2-deoxygluconokinase [Streptomyces]|uniref:5-dehydro-2-deoxygluconokinase n=1 Tax=Streptomyces clavifer TaxID=68188 RepID=A0ABS4VBM2_9ACTN|nr:MULTISPECIES: 5-dehydro-2-deoxygluconokinase [Streptomyces]MBP2361319.1 5-dehydro-2-deoxygluconokinase [Streptomyces clavifer]MDX2744297.1 5-dehydro-2-deoxygluconokinase [Streptomyces sp. NRRL_B-2557]GHA93722.1 5-dehydro-2-deoxygluconokinase [Streptomyces clavifer]